MSNYTKLIYPENPNSYPSQLCSYIHDRFMFGNGKYLLDIGCSKGTHFREFDKLGMIPYGLDIRKDFNSDRVWVSDITKDKIPFEDNSFDFIWNKSVIEHIDNPENMIKESMRVLKPNGIIIIITPDWEKQMSHFWDDYTHCHPYTRKSLRDLLSIHGFDADCEYFYQFPWLWQMPWLKFIPKWIDRLTTQSMKWKNKNMRNGQDRKLIRFSKERMLLAWGVKRDYS